MIATSPPFRKECPMPPFLPSRFLFLCCGLLAFWLGSGQPFASGQDRQKRYTPGLVLETGARTGSCDALLFSENGDQLLATGDDKVVRFWDVGPDSFASKTPRRIHR